MLQLTGDPQTDRDLITHWRATRLAKERRRAAKRRARHRLEALVKGTNRLEAIAKARASLVVAKLRCWSSDSAAVRACLRAYMQLVSEK